MAVTFMYCAGNALPDPAPAAELLAHHADAEKIQPALRAWIARNCDETLSLVRHPKMA
jgi:hypothetical protein